ncbi:MAG TPA: zinc finger domain-containing protein, partial [Acidocella sp.]|nr:zinc finger domain-containing protein [Acidocella sp.]
ESWTTRFGADVCVHTTLFPKIPEAWRNDALAEKWDKIRGYRSGITSAIESWRRDKTIGSSLQAEAIISPEGQTLLNDLDLWADICITSSAVPGLYIGAAVAPGEKCERCWRVLPEVGTNAKHPTLCIRCCEAVA